MCKLVAKLLLLSADTSGTSAEVAVLKELEKSFYFTQGFFRSVMWLMLREFEGLLYL